MKKGALALILTAAFLLFIIPFSQAALQVEKVEKKAVLIVELDDSAVFELTIDNNATTENAEIYSMTGVIITPKEKFTLPAGRTKMEISAKPQEGVRREGTYGFEYQIKGDSSGIFKDTLAIKFVPLSKVLQLEFNNLRYDEDETLMTVKNTQNTEVQNITLRINSDFFSFERVLSFGPFEKLDIPVKINTDKVRKLRAGAYIITGDVYIEGIKGQAKGTLNYVEKKNTLLIEKNSGFIIREKNLTKISVGNMPLLDKITVRKNVLSRLFTINSIEPTSVDRRGFIVEYTWEKELKPGESWSVIVTTNYTLPFIFVILILVIAWLVYSYSMTDVIATKRVSYVKTKGGQFALRINVKVKARKPVENVKVMERLPQVAKLYEGFGSKPHAIDAATRRLIWNLERLNAGEERHFTYIIYSDINIIGKFELPVTAVEYVKGNEKKIVHSNKAYFLADIHPKFS